MNATHMWQSVKQIGNLSAIKPANDSSLRRPSMNLNNLGPGSVISFSSSCPLPQFSGKRATITQVRTYRFGDDIQISYGMNVNGREGFSLTVAEDAEGYYLALSRELTPKEQDEWFGRDALSFFTEPSTAKTIRCKTDLAIEGAWAAPRYVKSVDWISGSVLLGRMSTASIGRQVKQFHYNLLVNETADRAIEIEHEDETGDSRILATVYRPVEDIAGLAEPVPYVPAPQPAPTQAQQVAAQIAPSLEEQLMTTLAAAIREEEEALVLTTPEEPALFAPPSTIAPHVPRTDFRRLSGTPTETIHVAREEVKPQPVMDAIMGAGIPPLPSFLTSRDTSYLSLDAVIPPETDRVRCDLRSAKVMIDMAIARGVRVRDVLREVVGLDSMLNDEVIFEMPLTDDDYRKLAMRYKLRPDHRDEIRSRLQEELAQRLIGVAKR